MKILKKRINKENTMEIAKNTNKNIMIASFIDQMGIKSDNVHKYLNPTIEDLYDPFLFLDMEKAVDRIILAMEKNEKILIYGDYDADGNTATAILMLLFRYINYENVEYLIPNRIIDGYGISMNKIDEIKSKNINLVITVDCGIKNIKEIEALKNLGIDVVLTDHHEQGEEIPDAFAVINPKVKKEKYPFKDLAGAGVSFKLASAILKKTKIKLDEVKFLELMMLAAIGTIADIMPLVDENRAIIKLAIKKYNEYTEKKKSEITFGIKNLIDTGKKLNEQEIAFYVVPKINASGRMGEEIAIEYILEKDSEKEIESFNKLHALNEKRKDITNQQTEEIISLIENEIKKKKNKPEIIFAGKENLHEGIIGIIASKISEKYKCPAIIYTNKSQSDTEMVASSRCTNQDVNLYNILDDIKDDFVAFGGHDFAAGFSFETKNEKKLKEKFEKMTIEKIEKSIKYNNTLNLKETNLNLAKEMEALRPYGNGNEEPIFLFKNLNIKQINSYPKVTRIVFQKNEKGQRFPEEIVGISFDTKENLGVDQGKTVNVLGNLSINSYNGFESVQIMVIKII